MQVLVTKESSANSGDNTIFNTRVLLGNDRVSFVMSLTFKGRFGVCLMFLLLQDLLHVIAKTLTEPLQSEVPVLLGISLKNESASLVKRIAARLTVLTQSLQ